MSDSSDARLGVVAIGRNEGERLRHCIESVVREAVPMVYVDSGSTDGSVEMAQRHGVDVVELDMDQPFTAARARNAGLDRLLQGAGIAYVQFVDGDCEIAEGWLARAQAELDGDPHLAVVCGRRRERFPDATLLNRICDIEWDTPIGPADACGGDSMMRVETLLEAGRFDPTLIAGEEPELCFRIRKIGGRVRRIDAEMTLHDAAMTQWAQWWKRSQRSGHAYAERHWMHRNEDPFFVRRENSSMVTWGFIFPVVGLFFAPFTFGLSLLALPLGYGLVASRVYAHYRRRGFSAADALLYGVHCAAIKIPQFTGLAQYHLNRIRGKRATLIEYK